MYLHWILLWILRQEPESTMIADVDFYRAQVIAHDLVVSGSTPTAQGSVDAPHLQIAHHRTICAFDIHL
jgi:extradiol dioxygenase family protein